jgi:hypothetical protein
MMRQKFCCEASRGAYEEYYQQQGRGVPVFQGSRGQRGHGIGSVLGGLFRQAMPMIKTGLASLGKQALRTGMQIASDWAGGRDIGEAAQSRFKEGIKTLATSYTDSNQTGSGRRRKNKTKHDKTKRVKTKLFKKRKLNDIFH